MVSPFMEQTLLPSITLVSKNGLCVQRAFARANDS